MKLVGRKCFVTNPSGLNVGFKVQSGYTIKHDLDTTVSGQSADIQVRVGASRQQCGWR